MRQDAPDILLIEDDRDHAELIVRGLRAAPESPRVHRVRDGQAALGYLADRDGANGGGRGRCPRLVLLDLRLPGMTGLDVLRRIKDSPGLRRIPVVVLSGSSSAEEIAQAYDLGANAFVVKPAGFEGFGPLMADLARFWLGRNCTCVRSSLGAPQPARPAGRGEIAI